MAASCRWRSHELRWFLVGFKLPRTLIVHDDSVAGSRHTRDHGDLAKTAAQMPAQDFQPSEIALSYICRSMKILKARMRRRVVFTPQQFLERHELPNAGRQCIEKQKEGPILEIGKFDLHIDNELPNFLEGGESIVDAIVAAFPSRQNTAVAEPQNDFASNLAFEVVRADGNADERQIQRDITDPPSDLSAGTREQISEIKFEWNAAPSHSEKIASSGLIG